MITNKICFIHLREATVNWPRKEYAQNGGATIGWMVTSSGDIVVGNPARCREDEKFVKQLGREEAIKKFQNEQPFFRLSHAELVRLGVAHSISSVDFDMLTPRARFELMTNFKNQIQETILDALSSRWFEERVRDRLILVDNRVEYNTQADLHDMKVITTIEGMYTSLQQKLA